MAQIAGGDGARLHHFDAAHAIMLLMGIPYHAALLYRLSGDWILVSPDRSVTATLIVALIHSFRMPAFFILSGYFGAMLLHRRGASAWLRQRLLRIGVPIVGSLLLFGFAEHFLLSMAQGDMNPAEVLADMASRPDFLFHRWFLIVLLLLSLALLGVLPLAQHYRSAAAVFVRRLQVRGLIWLPLAALCLASVAAGLFDVAAQALGWPLFAEYGRKFLYFAPFFFAGAACQLHGRLLVHFLNVTRRQIWITAILLLCYVASYRGFYGPDFVAAHPYVALGIGIVRDFTAVATGFAVTRLFLAWARNRFAAPSQRVRYVVDGALGIYLSHMLFVLLYGGMFLHVTLPPMLEIALISGASLLSVLAVHHLTQRSHLLALLLNGTPLRLRAEPRFRSPFRR
ncbi:acyltransferase family protein [Stakelama tenebrarum]|uniref:Acyltransferase family protein n=1 Tax=Stakelama tenebrarum TaxID=2711215 RepID=A0A6G6Y5Q2_9SPHN|nr:acyltransferase family protein [Sphingosinithalassobacter tenebrarum]QIG80262.1 acyltransferase family protein [Sphingosinithalassobacter tenebrarum]